MTRDHLLGFPPVLLGLAEVDPSLATPPATPRPPPAYRTPPGVQAQLAALDRIQMSYISAHISLASRASGPPGPGRRGASR